MHKDTASKTACVVAKSQALIGAIPRFSELIDPEARNFTREALRVSGHGNFLRAISLPVLRRMICACENLKIPGLALHQVIRKRLIERRVIDALKLGVEEVVQIGAGLDSLCFRLHQKWPNAKFIEVDHPATQRIKNKVIQSLGGVGTNFEMKPQNLCLRKFSKNRKEETCGRSRLIVAEGLLMYFSEEEVQTLLRTWRRRFGNRSRLLFTFLDREGFHHQTALVNLWLRLVGEPFQWWSNQSAVSKIVIECGWSPSDILSTWNCEKFTRWSRDQNIAEGEWILDACAI